MSGPRFVRADKHHTKRTLCPGDPELEGIELWIAEHADGARGAVYVIRPTDQDQRVFVQVKTDFQVQPGDLFIAGRQRLLFEGPHAVDKI